MGRKAPRKSNPNSKGLNANFDQKTKDKYPNSSESDNNSSSSSKSNSPPKKPRTSTANDMEEDFANNSSNSSSPSKTAATDTPKTISPVSRDLSNDQQNQETSQSGSPLPFEEILHSSPFSTDKDKNVVPNSPLDTNASRHAGRSSMDTDDADDDVDQEYAVVGDASTFKAAANWAELVKQKETKKACLNRINLYCQELFPTTCLGVSRFGKASEENLRLVVSFSSETHRNEFLVVDHSPLSLDKDKDNDNDNSAVKFFAFDPISLLSEERSQSISVRDIPLNFNRDDLFAHFKGRGLIQRIRIHLPHNATFKAATVVFASQDSMQFAFEEWGSFCQGEFLRFFPSSFSKEEADFRFMHSAVLRNLPPNIKAVDLQKIFVNVGAKSIGLPRHIPSYNSKAWAYFAFSSDELRDNAMELTCYLKDFPLY